MLHLVDKGRSFVQKFIPFIFCYKLKSHLERNLFDLFMLVLFLQLTAILCQLLQKKEYINQRKWSTKQYTLYFCILFLSTRFDSLTFKLHPNIRRYPWIIKTFSDFSMYSRWYIWFPMWADSCLSVWK